MRAATIIVGAIAVSSCLIALALILSGGNDGSRRVVVRPPEEVQLEKGAGESHSADSGSSAVSTPTQCNVGVTVEGASCFLGKEVLAAYKEGSRGQVTAIDPESGEAVTLSCGGTAPTICRGEDDVTVYLAP